MSTLTSYSLIARDVPAALGRKAAEPVTARETAYFKARIGQVKSVDAFLGDRRLYAYAMKAFGLEEMTYAKGFMRKVLEGGVSSPTSFANRLSDDRYVAIARAFTFDTRYAASALGTDAVTASGLTRAAGSAKVTGSIALRSGIDFSGGNEVSLALSSQVGQGDARTLALVLNRDTLAALVPGVVADLTRVTAFELVGAVNALIEASGERVLKGAVVATLDGQGRLAFETTGHESLGSDGAVGGTGEAADLAYAATGAIRALAIEVRPPSGAGRKAVEIGFGTETGPDAQTRATVDAYLRQSLEADAGEADTGVRLALYFARKAPGLKSPYQILGDKALSQVANTVLGLPATSGAATSQALERRAALIAAKIDLPSLQDPAKLETFLRRFATIWDAQNAADSEPVLALFGGSGADGALGASSLLALQRSRSRI